MKKQIIKKIINVVERFDLDVDDYYFHNIFDGFTDEQIKKIQIYNQIASFLWLDVECNVLKIRIYDLLKISDNDIVIEIKGTKNVGFEVGEGEGWYFSNDILAEIEKGLLVFFSVINPCTAAIYNSYYQSCVDNEGNLIECCSTINHIGFNN